jgi:hypothetical protein
MKRRLRKMSEKIQMTEDQLEDFLKDCFLIICDHDKDAERMWCEFERRAAEKGYIKKSEPTKPQCETCQNYKPVQSELEIAKSELEIARESYYLYYNDSKTDYIPIPAAKYIQLLEKELERLKKQS